MEKKQSKKKKKKKKKHEKSMQKNTTHIYIHNKDPAVYVRVWWIINTPK